MLQQISDNLPDGWEEMSGEHQLHFLVKAFTDSWSLNGEWILVNGNMTLLELLEEAKQQT